METLVLQVEGMSCTGCEQRIGTVLRRVEGVRVEVRVGPEMTDRAVLAERIEAAGYQVIEGQTR
jgi:copper chaperone